MDWLVLFLQPHLHIDTVTKALRLLCQLLRDHTIMQKFMAGELFGGWLHGMESLCPDMCVKFERSKFNPLRASNSTLLPGIPLLTQFLPKHPKCSRALLILFALMLGTPSTDVPPSGTVDVETMDTIFSLKATRGPVCYDAAFILLAVVKDMLHNVRGVASYGSLSIYGSLSNYGVGVLSNYGIWVFCSLWCGGSVQLWYGCCV